jgi:NTP pyrophosphatase (non-canonical NTP hydrolase)
MGDSKEAALKPLEEAAEVFGAWQDAAYACDEGFLKNGCCSPQGSVPCTEFGYCRMMDDLADEIADTIQACVNLADRYGLDLADAMERCEKRNRARGRCE